MRVCGLSVLSAPSLSETERGAGGAGTANPSSTAAAAEPVRLGSAASAARALAQTTPSDSKLGANLSGNALGEDVNVETARDLQFDPATMARTASAGPALPRCADISVLHHIDANHSDINMSGKTDAAAVQTLGGLVAPTSSMSPPPSPPASPAHVEDEGGGPDSDATCSSDSVSGYSPPVETQEFGEEKVPEEEVLTRLVGDEAAGIAALLPSDENSVLAIGRERQPSRDGVAVDTVVLPTIHAPGALPPVSRLQAEVRREGEALVLHTLGKTFSFVNDIPLRINNSNFAGSERLYDGDILRLGGDLNGPAGDVRDYMFRVDAPSLGQRPPVPQAEAGAMAPPPPRAAPPPPHAAPPPPPGEVSSMSGGGEGGGGSGEGGGSTPLWR